MHSRFFCGRNAAPAADTSPRRRLRLFSVNDRPRKEALPAAPLVAKVTLEPTSREESESSFAKEQPTSPRSPKKFPSSTRKSKNPAPPLPRRSVPPPPLLERNEHPSLVPSASASTASSSSSSSAAASRPGVSFQRNNDAANDPIAAKMSTFDNRAGVQSRPNPIHDPIAAKIAANDSNSCPNPTHDPIAAKIADQVTYMEIAPGQHVRLRGAKETWQCVENDFYLPTTCFACDSDLCCIMDASYVLCPNCKTVSPVEGWADSDGGVGLGFTYQDLVKWQQEIVQRRQQDGF